MPAVDMYSISKVSNMSDRAPGQMRRQNNHFFQKLIVRFLPVEFFFGLCSMTPREKTGTRKSSKVLVRFLNIGKQPYFFLKKMLLLLQQLMKRVE